jgi:hypothetical protein
MTNPKARAVTERLTSLFDNPEVTAMAAICEILQELPDDAARLRVMHWSFGRFNAEFKRPLSPAAQAPASAPAPDTAAAAAPVPAAAELSLTNEIAAVAPDIAAGVPPRDEDFGSQISELRDLFTQTRYPSRRSVYADGF